MKYEIRDKVVTILVEIANPIFECSEQIMNSICFQLS